ncbi:RluA family pseudouridine synthase [Vampirovibrio sp.]|uniref:RluA family pseudouridine synthase n=1 Tax=Vampirovibrio sp. TaxID=2717857 RepID=UPI0035948C66
MSHLPTPENTTQYRLLISEEDQGERLDKRLAAELEDYAISRERLQTLIKDGRVQVNEKAVSKASLRLKEGDVIVVSVPEAQPIALAPEYIPLDVIFEDDCLLVVNKPSGMLTHPTGREREGTLVNALLAHCGSSLSGINGQIRPGIVHRLDRDTSGLLMVAKTDAAHFHLSAQLKDKTARRDYRAIAQGVFPENCGTVDAPIGRNPKQRDKMAILPDGRNAVTHWRVQERLADKFALLELSLETGRTHQIRVHLSHIGHPLFGDPLYGSGIEKVAKLKTQGQMLQAFRLSFQHPKGEQVTFEIPQDPEISRIWQLLSDKVNASG